MSDRLVEGTQKFGGGSLIIWGCMLWEGVGDAYKSDGRIDGVIYIKILEDDLLSSLAFYDKTPQGIIFKQANDPEHTCKKAQNWFQDHVMQVLL